MKHGAVDHPAHHSADEDGQGGGDGEVGPYGEGEGAYAEELDDDDQRDSKKNQGPGKLLGEDAIDDGSHELALGCGGLLGADALNPLNLDLAGSGVEEVLAVRKRSGADSVEQGVVVAVGDLFFAGTGFCGSHPCR